jgi:hypothetical protein
MGVPILIFPTKWAVSKILSHQSLFHASDYSLFPRKHKKKKKTTEDASSANPLKYQEEQDTIKHGKDKEF